MSATPILALTALIVLAFVARERNYRSTSTSLIVLTGTLATVFFVFRFFGLQ
jgi:hypothetical protein